MPQLKIILLKSPLPPFPRGERVRVRRAWKLTRPPLPAAAAGTALADKTGGGGLVQALNNHRAALFAHSQDNGYAPAAHMTGEVRPYLGAGPQAPQELPQSLHMDSMTKIVAGSNPPELN
jgi:hypothetical protein